MPLTSGFGEGSRQNMAGRAKRQQFANNKVSHLKLVTESTKQCVERVAVKTDRRCKPLPTGWQQALDGWSVWMTASGAPKSTTKLRVDHVRVIAHRSQSRHPNEITLDILIRICSASDWSRAYRRGIRCSLIKFFDWAVDNEVVPANPAAKMPRVPIEGINPNPVPDEVWEQILLTSTERDRMMIKLAGLAGMRRAEVAQMRREDLIRDGDKWLILVHGKGGKQRTVQIHDKLAASIREFCPGGYLFPGTRNGHLTAKTVGIVVSRAMPAGWTMHKLRHRYATRGLEHTGNLLAVRDALGHASVATTQIYTRSASSMAQGIADAAAADDR